MKEQELFRMLLKAMREDEWATFEHVITILERRYGIEQSNNVSSRKNSPYIGKRVKDLLPQIRLN
jgi:hypothetical protein